MKTIYISNNKSRSNKIWFLGLLIVVAALLLGMRIMAPFAIEAWINSAESTNGYAFRVNDIDVKFLKGEVYLRNMEIYDPATNLDVVEARDVKIDLYFLNRIGGGKFFDLHVNHMNVILTSDLINQFKSMAYKADGDFSTRISNVVMSQAYGDKIQKVFTLNNALIDVKGKTFKFTSQIAEGGRFELKGDSMKVDGKLTDVSPLILSRLSQDNLPVEIRALKFNADISAVTAENGVEGTLKPDSNNFRLPAVNEKTVKRRPSQKNNKELDPLVIEIPFRLKDNFSLFFDGTVDELRKRNL